MYFKKMEYVFWNIILRHRRHCYSLVIITITKRTEENIMSHKANKFGLKIAFFGFIFSLILIPFQTTFADSSSEGITLEKDVYLQGPILGAEDLPDEVTFSLYDSETAVVPLATQNFARGNYALDFDFNKSDGLSSGSVARFKVAFTNRLNLDNATESAKQPKQIWAELSINDIAVGNRTLVPDNAMVQLLLASDASIATYLTLAYEGDDNPITTIYRDLPLSSSAGLSATDYISSLFRVSSIANDPLASTTPPYWELSGSNIYYNNGYVGVGTSLPQRSVHLRGSNTTMRIDRDADTVGFMLHRFPTGNYTTPWKGYLLGVNASGPNNGYFLISDYAQAVAGGNTIRFVIDNSGSVGIGTTAPAYKLAVNGSIGCKELTVTSTGWPDFVFQDNYKLPALDDVENFITKNKHLPDIPSASDVEKNGVSVGEMSAKLLKKLEELTLYVIDLKKENQLLKGQVETIRSQIDNMEK